MRTPTKAATKPSTSGSALRVADQVAGRLPDRCVLTGTATTGAVKLTAVQWRGPNWLLAVPGFAMAVGVLPGRTRHAVTLPISVTAWKIWSVRNGAAWSIMAAGLMFASIGFATGVVGLTVFGLIVLVAAMAYRTRAHHNYWVTCRYAPHSGLIVVAPTHRLFDAAARDLFVRSLR